MRGLRYRLHSTRQERRLLTHLALLSDFRIGSRAAVADRLTAQPVYSRLRKYLCGVTRGKLIVMVIA